MMENKTNIRLGARLLLVFFLLLLASSPAFPQKTKGKSKTQLQNEITSLQKEISTANQLLKKTTSDKEMTLNEVSILDKKIRQRQRLIKAYNEQIAVLDEEIKAGQNNIQTLNADLAKTRKEYAKMVSFAYRNRSHYNNLGFVFAADDFNQAFQRLRYIRQINDARKVKINQITGTERRITSELEANRLAREQQAEMLADEKEQQAALQQEREELRRQVANLKKKEGSLQQDIKNKQQQAKKLQKAIDDIIAEEVRAAKERRRKEEEISPSEVTLSANFVSNKGKLPWPVERGVVSSSFGKHTSVISDKVTITNNGIDIATTEGTKARAVFDGEVTSVTQLTGSNTVVIIRHGEYFSVYSNLENVTVKRGDIVKTKESLGTVHTSKTENKTELHFEILKETNRQNPAHWLTQ